MSSSGYVATDDGVVNTGNMIEAGGFSFDASKFLNFFSTPEAPAADGDYAPANSTDSGAYSTRPQDVGDDGFYTGGSTFDFSGGGEQNTPAEKDSILKQAMAMVKDNPKLLQAGLLALGGGMQGLLGASAKDKEIKAAKEMLETKEQQTIAAEQRLAQRAAYGKVGKQEFKDTGLLAAAMKEKK